MEKRFEALVAKRNEEASEPWTFEVERIMKRAKAQGVSDATILAGCLYEAMKRIEKLEAVVHGLDHRTMGSIRIGGCP